MASRRLSGNVARVIGGEDIASEVITGFLHQLDQVGFRQPQAQQDLWELLLSLAQRRITDNRRRQSAQKRGGNSQLGESGMGDLKDPAAMRPMQQVEGREPTPEEAVEFSDLIATFLNSLPDQTLRRIAAALLGGQSQVEMQRDLNLSHATVQRKIQIIRQRLRHYLTAES